MANFRIWGRVEQTAPAHFLVVVSAVHDPPLSFERTAIKTGEAQTRQEAEELRNQLMQALGEDVRAHGDRVVDVEEA